MNRTDLLKNSMYPVMLVSIMIVLHFIGGTIQLDIPSKDAQRDLNTALGTSLLCGVFLLSIRVIQKSVAKHLSLILGVTKTTHEFKIHRQKLSDQFKKHLIWSVSVAFAMPLLYMMAEGVILRINEKEVFIVAIGAIPFWLLMSLYILQVTTVNRYLWRFLHTDWDDRITKIKVYESIITVATITISTILLVLLVMPVFWINLAVHIFDMFFVFLLCSFFMFYLISPLINFYRKLRQVKLSLASDLDKKIEGLIRESVMSERSKEIEYLVSLKEKYCNINICFIYK